MARTDQQAFLDAYLGGGISANRSKVKSAGSTGTAAMNAGANVSLPSLYDFTDDVTQVGMAYVEAAQKQQEAAAKAAQQAAKKAQKEAQKAKKQAEDAEKAVQKTKSQESVLPSLASLQARKKAAKSTSSAQKETAEDKTPGFFQKVGGALSSFGGGASRVASKISDNLDNALAALFPKVNTENAADFSRPGLSLTWQEANAMDAQRVPEWQKAQAEAAAQQAERVAEQAAENEVYRAYSKLDTKDKMDAQAILRTTIAFGTEAEKEQAQKELAAVEKALWNDEGYLKLVQKSLDDEPEQSRIDRYLDPSYQLNKLEEKDAKEIADALLDESNKMGRTAFGVDQNTRQQAQELFDTAQRLYSKTSDAQAVLAGALDAIPLFRETVDTLSGKINEQLYPGEDLPSASDSFQNLQTQSPIAYGAGNIGGNLALYAAGSAAARSIPSLQRVGQAAAATPAAQALQKVPVLGRLGTADAITGIVGDTAVDLTLDTAPRLLGDVYQYAQQQALVNQGLAEGKTLAEMIPSLEEYQGEYLTPGGIAADTLKGVGTNLAFNLGGELVPELLKVGGQKLRNEFASVPSLDDGAQTAARVVGNTDVPSLDDTAQAVRGGVDDVVNAWRSGTLTNAQLETLKPGGVNRAAFEQATGVKLPDTSSDTRKFLRSIDNQQAQVYDEINNMAQGGALNERTGENAVRGMAEDAERSGAGAGNGDVQGRVPAGGNPVLRQFLTPSENINEAIKRSGATPMELVDTTGNPQFFSFALEQARQTNPNGLMVSGKTVEELSQPGTVTFMSKDGLTGALVTADGDIEAVFKNPRSSARGAGSSLLLNAINNGGTKLDCYGDGLVYLYNRHGFEPVARVPWNPEYAPDGWTYGPKDVYVMKLSNGLSAGAVASRLGLSEAEGGFHIWSKAELDELPTMDYDQALAYRDSLIAAENQSADTMRRSVAASADDTSQSISAPLESYAANEARSQNSVFSEPEIPNGYKERGFAESIRTKTDLPDEVKQEFVDNPELYRAISNSETSARADAIYAQGLDRSMVEYNKMLSAKDPAAVPLGKKIADELISQGRRDEAVDVLRQMSQNLTQSGQFSQAAAIALLKNDPMTALQYVQKNIDQMNKEGLKKFGPRKWKDFSLTPDEIDAFGKIEYGDEEAMKAAFEGISKRLSREYPATTLQKLVEASHVAMLLNPRTQIRNLAANLAFRPLNILSRKASAAGQKVYKFFNKDYQPTQALSLSKQSKALADDAYKMVRDTISGNVDGKWENTIIDSKNNADVFKLHGDTNVVSRIPVLGDMFSSLGGSLGKFSEWATGGKNVFQNLSDEKSVMENIRQFTYGLLELGDEPFVRKEFVDRMASFIEARGYKSLDEVPQEAFDAATQSALKATFKDDNRLTQLVSSIKKHTGPVGEVAMPFTKTPANIAVRAFDYSPAGLAMGIRRWVKNGGDPSAYIDDISKGLTGTALIGLGALLYKAGIITGPASDNADQAQYDKMQGKLPYSFKIGDNYYTFDWMQPASSALILGSTLASEAEKNGGLDGQTIAEAFVRSVIAMGDTLLDMSPLQSLSDIFGGYETPTGNLINEIVEFPQRFIPSALGAVARVADPVQRQTFSNGDTLATQIATAQSKIPGASQSLPAAYDTWGREITRADNLAEGIFNQFVNPGQTGNANPTPMDDEITRLFEATGQTGVFPQKANWSETYGGETHKLTNEQYSDYQRTMGQISYDGAFSLLDSEIYGLLDDQQKAKAIQSVYAVGRDKALQDIFPDYSVPETRQKQVDVYDTLGAEGLADWLSYKAIADADGNDAISQNEALAALNAIPSLDDDDRAYFWYLTNSKWKKNPYM